jgi:hypothetical protein
MIFVIKSKLTVYLIVGTVHPPYYISKMFWPVSIIQAEAVKFYVHDYRKV